MKYQIEDCSSTSALVVAIDVDGIVHSEWLVKFVFQPVGRYNVESIEYSEYDIVDELLSSSFALVSIIYRMECLTMQSNPA